MQPWLAALPNPTSAGPLNNFQAPPIPDTILGDSDYYMWRIDSQIGNNDHVFASFWHQRAPAKFYSQLPQAIATETYSDPQNSWVNRMNYDKVFTNTFLNHMSMGYLNRNEGYGCVNQDFVDEFPQIGGVAGNNVPPTINLDKFNSMGCNAGVNLGNVTTRPTFIINDAVTWTKSAHTIKVGMEWRKIMGNIHANGNEAGTFGFGGGATGLVGVNSGNAVASFLLGAADNANVSYRSVPSWYARQHAWIFHAGDSWRLSNKLTLDYGLRWDYYSPSSEKYDQMSFLDPTGANPGAAGRPGRLAFAGDAYGAASYGKRLPGGELVRRSRSAPRRRLRAERQDGHPRRVGHLLHPGVLPGLGWRDEPGRVLERPVRERGARAASSPRCTWTRASRSTSSRCRPTSGRTTRTARASTTATSTATSGRTRTSGTSRSIASSATSSR